ncbi:AMP-binding protein [Candidatus Saccharibacteria bacterium]|nr:AMP-binding protein [Candidatus Saccharibacteria bacterium]
MLKKNYPYYKHKKVKNFAEFLDLLENRYHKRVAFSFHSGEELVKKTYPEFVADVKSLAGFLNKNYAGKHLAICGENSYEWIVTFMAIVLSGNVAVPIDKDCDEKLLLKLLKSADCDTLFYSEKYLPFASELKFKTQKLEDTARKIKLGKKYKNAHKPVADAPAVIFFTSGTTGAHKCVALSEKNITADIYGASSIYQPGGATVSILPFHHSFGLVTAIMMPAYYGCDTYICSSLKRFTDAMKEHQPETIFLVPAFVEAFYRQIWRKARTEHKDKALKMILTISKNLKHVGLDVRRVVARSVLKEFGGELRHIICGGAYLDPIYVKWFRTIGIDILNGYGITECSPVLSVNRNKYYKDGSVGVPCRGVDVKIFDGEICAKGDNVMLGYYEKGKIKPQEGYFHTGDLGKINRDGFIFITGRIKNTIILSNGENVSPETIESDFMKFKGVREVVAYGKNDEICLMIFPEEDRIGDKIYFETLRRRYNYSKPRNRKVARISLRTTEFIKNSSQKIIRSKIMEENDETRSY